jgi:hypothetical protein
MAYNGTTAGSTLANPPMLLAKGVGGNVLNNGSTLNGTGKGAGTGLWLYTSTETSTGPLAANYFSDGYYLGMKAGDIVMCVGSTGGSTAANLTIMVLTSGSTAGFGGSTGAMITSTFG